MKKKIIFLWAEKWSWKRLISLASLTEEKENQGHKQEYYRARTQACEPWPQGSLSFLHGPCPHSEAWFGEAKVKQQSLTSLSCWDWTLTPTTEMSTTKQHGHQKAYKYNVPKSKPMLRKIHSLNLYEYPETIIITEVRLSCENWEVPDYHSPIQGDPNGGSKAQDDNGTREHRFEGVGQSKGTPAYVKGPGPPCLPVPHQELASNQRNASVTTTRLTSTLGASTHWWQFRISLRCFNHSRTSGHNFPLLRCMEDPLDFGYKIKSRDFLHSTWFLFQRTPGDPYTWSGPKLIPS